MKKALLAAAMITMILGVNCSWAQELEKKDVESAAPLSVVMFVRGDVCQPKGGEVSMDADLFAWVYSGSFGGGGQVTIAPDSNYTKVRGFVSYKFAKLADGPVIAILGATTSSTGANHIQTEAWWINTVANGKIDFLVDLTQNWAVSKEAGSYLDLYGESVYKITGKVAIGPALGYDHYWKTGGDSGAIGPIAYYKLTDKLSPFVRPMYGWDTRPGKEDSWNLRFGIKGVF